MDSALVLILLLTLVAGVAIAMQAGVNAQLGRSLGDPVVASFISFSVGTVCLGIVLIAMQRQAPSLEVVANVPSWAWIGGALGAFFVTVGIYVAPRLGAASFVAIIVAAQLITALLLDHFGLLGFETRAATWPRIFGAGLLAGGVILIRFA